jgi:hypothetical protein
MRAGVEGIPQQFVGRQRSIPCWAGPAKSVQLQKDAKFIKNKLFNILKKWIFL